MSKHFINLTHETVTYLGVEAESREEAVRIAIDDLKHCREERVYGWSTSLPCETKRTMEARQGDFVDAAEFEARVAVKLATNKFYLPCMAAEGCWKKLCHVGCFACRLMWARLEVEEEMGS